MLSRRQFCALAASAPAIASQKSLRIAVFSSDVTPPVGSALCYGLVKPAKRVGDPLLARGIVLLPNRQPPIVLCALDWLGIGNGSQDLWKQALARAAGTVPDRVAVHTVHQHDAPGDDATAQELLRARGLDAVLQPADFCRLARRRVAAALRKAKAVPVTHIATGSARVEGVASNRRILGADGKVAFVRYTACRNSPHCGDPEGVIDPLLRSVSFWNGEQRLAALHYYATHPMSHYGQGEISADFAGLARRRQEGFAVYFTGAAGNIGAGKYNDGAPGKRAVLGGRLAGAMQQSLQTGHREKAGDLRWSAAPVTLPHRQGKDFAEPAIEAALDDPKLAARDRANAARYLAWYRLNRAGRNIAISALHLGETRILHLPGEPFVEYQIAAQQQTPAAFVAVAGYGDYGPMYIGTRKAYDQGGYETSQVSRVDPSVEDVLLAAIRKL